MKKLTAGIFSVLVGLCAADSAYAAIASEAWVDQVFVKNATYTTDKAGLETAIAKAQSDAEATAAGALASAKGDLEGKITDEENARKAADDAINAKIGTVPTGSADVIAYIDTKTSGIASDETVSALDSRVTANEGAISKLNGTATEEGSVAKSIADSIAALDLANTYDAKGSAAQALTDAKSYTDTKIGTLTDGYTNVVAYVDGKVADVDGDLGTVTQTADDAYGMATTNAETIAELSENKLNKSDFETFKTGNTAAIAAAQSGAEATAAADATSKADAALASAKAYTDAEIGEIGETTVKGYVDSAVGALSGTDGAITALGGRVGTLESTVNNQTTGVAANAALAAKNAQDIAKNAQDIATNTQNITANANAISALEETVNDETTGVAANAALAAQNAKDIATNATAIAANTEAIGANTKSIAANLTSIQTINNSDVMKSGITAEKVSDYDTSVGVTTGIAALTTGSDGTYVLTAKVADGKITGYTWEDITRAGN